MYEAPALYKLLENQTWQLSAGGVMDGSQ